MELSAREKKILKIVKKYEPVTGDDIAKELSISKSTIRTELALLVKLGLLESKTNVGYFYNNNFTDNSKYDLFKNTKVEDVMGVVITAKSTETFSEVVSKLFLHDIGTIFILNENSELAGVVSRKDLLKILVANANANSMPVAMAMTRMPNVVYSFEDEIIGESIRKIIHHEIDCLPIVRKTNTGYKVVGKISKTTIIRLLLDILEG